MVMETSKIFAERLVELRKEKGLKRQEVANALGVSRASLEYYEKGQRKPDIEIAARIAEYYNVSTDYLVGLSASRVNEEDFDLKMVCDYTGLSNYAIMKLKQITCRRELSKRLEEMLSINMISSLADTVASYRDVLYEEIESLQQLLQVKDDEENIKQAEAKYQNIIDKKEYLQYSIEKYTINGIRHLCYKENREIREIKEKLYGEQPFSRLEMPIHIPDMDLSNYQFEEIDEKTYLKLKNGEE